MLLYHGTTGLIAEKARTEGLKPRGGKPGNWPDKPSCLDCVYLSTVYGIAYAKTAHQFSRCSPTDELAIVEIDTDRLAQEALLPDEDFVGQCVSMRDSKAGRTRGELKEKHKEHNRRIRKIMADLGRYAGTDWYRILRKDYGNLYEYAHQLQQSGCLKGWQASVKGMGTCAYQGIINPEAITRIVFWLPGMHPIIERLPGAAPAIDTYHQHDKESFGSANQWLLNEGTWPDQPEYRNRNNIRVVLCEHLAGAE